MRILIISDTHGEDAPFLSVLEKTGPIDLLIHAGDFEGSDQFYAQWTGAAFYGVAGNNDFLSDVPYERDFQIGPHKVFLTHGNRYNVSTSTKKLIHQARVRKAQICIFGHTHRPLIDENHGILLLNPGSLTYPRQPGHRPSYILLEMDDLGHIKTFLNFL